MADTIRARLARRLQYKCCCDTSEIYYSDDGDAVPLDCPVHGYGPTSLWRDFALWLLGDEKAEET